MNKNSSNWHHFIEIKTNGFDYGLEFKNCEKNIDLSLEKIVEVKQNE